MKIGDKEVFKRIDDDSAPKKAFTFVAQDTKQKPFSFMKDNINDTDKFVINRLTDNGAYIRGGMLYFKLNGVEIFTDTDQSIFVDKKNNIVTIRKADNLKNIEDETDPELRQYIILIYGSGEEDEYRWESMTGRTTMYKYIKDNVEDIDVDQSIILTENVAIKDAFTVSQFVKYLQNGNLIEDEDFFDISLYSNE